ncbi:hypothetical protein BVH03_15325 [Pseudomonas sp. PA15(2017)]|nr:hypothetical protein BVH03_15325 [Pseudomonas sp. PA15(2017)]
MPVGHHVMLLLAVCAIGAALLLAPHTPDAPRASTPTPAPVGDSDINREQADPGATPLNRPTRYSLRSGDTLSAIFSAQGFSQHILQQILAADEELLALDVLRPGNSLVFHVDESDQTLKAMELQLHPGYRIEYRRVNHTSFEFEEFVSPSTWQRQVITGNIQGSFYVSAQQAGLSDADILKAQQILGERLNFNRDIRPGDHFDIVVGHQISEEGPTGQTRLEGIRLLRGNKVESAFLHTDSNYYDANGESLSRAFLRYPTEARYRISSAFNLRRLHPVTGRIAPHHGVDFAMPIGTPILSTGDGVIRRVGNHPFAGRYIEIEHNGQFKTRYLHLSRVLVNNGQQVKRGERIALSGNTGRSTGPHLHFELHVGNRPVDPIKAEIPTATRIAKAEMPVFTQKVRALLVAMDGSALHLARHAETAQSNSEDDS